MQRIILLCVLLTTTFNMNACDICGCSVMSGNPGILPKFRSHFIGIRQTTRSFTNYHPASLLYPDGSTSHNHFVTREIWGRWYPHKRIQAFISVPYNSFQMEENNSVRQKSGLGDASLLINYLIFNTGDSSKRKFKHLLMAGLGAKFNTGHFDPNEIAAFQIGTGTKDYQAYLSYTSRYKLFGGLTEISARRMGTNPNQYDFGDKLFLSQKLFYWIKMKQNSLLPHIGIMQEITGRDKSKGIYQDYSGGNATLLGFGLDTYISNINLGFNIYKPVIQNQGQGVVNESPRIQFNIIYNLKKKPTCK